MYVVNFTKMSVNLQLEPLTENQQLTAHEERVLDNLGWLGKQYG